MKKLMKCASVAALLLMSTTIRAEQTAAPKLTSFKVDVVLVRLDGTKVIGTSPFSLLTSLTTSLRPVSLRVGIDVPNGTYAGASGKSSETMFKTIGTQIDCTMAPFDDTRYAMELSISDTAVFSVEGAATVKRAEVAFDAANREYERLTALAKNGQATDVNVNSARTKRDYAALDYEAAKNPKVTRADLMAFRTFSSSSRLFLRDGEKQQIIVATDKTSGETLKAEVTLSVIK